MTEISEDKGWFHKACLMLTYKRYDNHDNHQGMSTSSNLLATSIFDGLAEA